jgi:2,4-dienoyl-CoA reductase-like NADH-dependent reductase (Old Yellow Enzyme family)
MPSLFDPIQVGDLLLPNRIFMAPLTRLRGTADHIPTSIMAEYYAQRASAGLIISEGVPVDPMGVGYANVPGIWSSAQTEAWKPITDAVHRAGGRIFAQIWHVGRISDPTFLDGKLPVAPSAIAAAGTVSLLRPQREYITPRALETDEVKGIVEAFWRGARNAQTAGFDGVELHGANGYLLDQFLQDGTNRRSDEYGGPIENRARLMLEATDAAISVFGAGRVGMHLAPLGPSHDISDSNPRETFGYVVRELDRRKIAFIVDREPVDPNGLSATLKQQFGSVFVANQGLDQAIAQQLLDEGKADAAAFGRSFIANPDLVQRFQQKTEFNQPVPETFYAHGPHGYSDYPALAPEPIPA